MDYEGRFRHAGPDPDAQQEARRDILEKQIERLERADWLGPKAPVLSLHLLDWDLRNRPEERFNKHIPMRTNERAVLAWYGVLGLLISADPERMRYTLTHHVFEHMSKRDAVGISTVPEGGVMFEVTQEPIGLGQVEALELTPFPPGIEDWGMEQELTKIKVTKSLVDAHLAPVSDLRDSLLAAARETTANLPMPWRGTLEQAQDLLRANSEIRRSFANRLSEAVDLFTELLHGHLELPEFTSDAEPLLGPRGPGQVPKPADVESVRRFLASLALVTFLSPPELAWRKIALIPGVSCIENKRPLSSEGFFLVVGDGWDTADGGEMDKNIWRQWLMLANLWAREKAVFDLGAKTREREQRHSVAFASHILATPLRGVSALARELPPQAPQREAILRQVTLMQALEKFSTCLVSESKPPPTIKSTSAEEFLDNLKKTVRDLCAIMQNPDLDDSAGMASHVRGQEDLWGVVSTHLEMPSGLTGRRIKWNYLQLYAVVDGVLSNALKYNRTDDKACVSMRVESQPNGGSNRIVLIVSSASDLTAGELENLKAALTECANIDWVGVSLIHLACRACGFRAPYWRTADKYTLQAHVQIGIEET